MKLLVLGASGIIGQHMRLCQPAGVDAVYARHKADEKHIGIVEALERLEHFDALVNLAGESNVDAVEKDPQKYRAVNVGLPALLAYRFRGLLVHVSSQIVRDPVNAYGQQKTEAEAIVKARTKPWTIARPTFVLGIRPDPTMGRENPAEQMLRLQEQMQVCDRWFSVSFADEVAFCLWAFAVSKPLSQVVQLGWPGGFTRYTLASSYFGQKAQPVSHDTFIGIAQRPRNTVYSDGLCRQIHSDFQLGIDALIRTWKGQHEPATICA